MAFNNTWQNCRPGRIYRTSDPNLIECDGDIAGGWRKKRPGYNDADRDTFTPLNCLIPNAVNYVGAKSSTWSSLNRASGYGSVTVRIQQRVNDWLAHYRLKGFSGVPANLNPDGILGSLSDTAIRYCQSRFGITRDGIVGQATWGRLIQTPPTA